MLHFPTLLKILTHLVLWWEGWGPYFFYAPFFTGPLRTIGAFGFFFLHFGFTIALRLGQFGCIGMFGPLVMLPKWFWEQVVFKRLRTRTRTGFVLYYNPHCDKKCRIIVTLLQNFFLIPETRVIPDDNLLYSSNDVSDVMDRHAGNTWDEKSVVVDINPRRTGVETLPKSWLVAQEHNGTVHTDFRALVAAFR
jgi:hypothetical protein